MGPGGSMGDRSVGNGDSGVTGARKIMKKTTAAWAKIYSKRLFTAVLLCAVSAMAAGIPRSRDTTYPGRSLCTTDVTPSLSSV